MFRDRPLTWLFFIATICIDLVMLVPVFDSPSIVSGDLPRMVFWFGVPAQLSLVAVWAALGKSHRLVRGAMVTLAVFLATTSVSLFSFSWRDLLTFYMAHTLLIILGMLILRSLGWLRRWPTMGNREYEKFRFSVIETFGWTTIVAIWAFAWCHTTAQDDFYGLFLANFTGLPIVIIALICRSERWPHLVLLMLVACAIAISFVRLTAGRFDSDAGFILLWGNLAQVAYLGMWYVVQRLDLTMQSNRVNTEKVPSAPLKMYQE